MSSIDDRIVRMSFDNAKFEKGAAQTISTLDKLDEKLKFKSAKKGSQDLERSFNSIDFSRMEKSIAAIEKRFTTLGVAGMNVINQITNGIIGSVKQLEAATIGQIKTGGWNRAMNIANAKFQIEGLGFEWGSIESAVNYGVKDTAYGLDAAATAASQLAASGVDFQNTLEDVNGQDLTAMHKSLRAISGVAAMTNSSYEDIARIFTTVAGNGRLMGDQLLQLSSRGMNAAAKLAETLGTTEADIRDMVSKGEIDFQTFAFAMDDAFGDHAKEANKTFTGALGNMKAALSRIGEIFTSPIINKTNTLFISITKRIDEIKNKLKRITVPKTIDDIKKEYKELAGNAAALNEILKASDGKALEFAGHFSEMWQSGIDAFSTMTKAVDLSWFDEVVKKVDKVTNKLKFFFDTLTEYFSDEESVLEENISSVSDTLTITAKEFEAAKAVIDKNAYGVGVARQKALAELFGGGAEGERHAKNVQTYIDAVIAAGWSYEKAAIKVEQSTPLIDDATGKFKEQAEAIEALKTQYKNLPGYAYDAIEKSMSELKRKDSEPLDDNLEKTDEELKKERIFKALDTLKASMSNIFTVAKNLTKAIAKVGRSILNAFSSVFKMDFGTTTDGIVGITEALVALSEKLIISDATASKITVIFTKLFDAIKNGSQWLWDASKSSSSFMKNFIESDGFENIKKKVTDIFDSLKAKVNDKKISIAEAIEKLFSGIQTIVEKFRNLPSSIADFCRKFVTSVKGIDMSMEAINVIDFIMVIGTLTNVARLLLALKKIGSVVNDVVMLPTKIGILFSNMGLMFREVGDAALMVGFAKSVKMIAQAIVLVALVIWKLGTIEPTAMYRGLGAVVIIGLLLRVLTQRIRVTSAAAAASGAAASGAARTFKLTLAPFFSMGGAILGMGALIGAIGFIIYSVTSAAEKFANNFIVFKYALGILAVAIIACGAYAIWIWNIVHRATTAIWKDIAGIGLLSLAILSLGGVILEISAALTMLAVIPDDKVANVLIMLAVILGGLTMVLAIFGSGGINLKGVWQLALVFAALGGVITALSGLMLIFAALPKESFDGVANVITTILLSLLGIAVIISLASTRIGGKYTDSHGGGTVLAGFIGIAVALLAVVYALKKLSEVGNLSETAESVSKMLKMIGFLAIAFGGMVALLGFFSDQGMSGRSGINMERMRKMLSTLAISIIGVSAAVLLFAIALEKIANIGEGSTQAFVAIGVFLGIFIILGAVAAAIPAFATGMEKAGTAMLSFGLGAALIGAGIFLVNAGLKILAPYLPVLDVGLKMIFKTLKENWPVAVGLGVFILALVGLIAYAAGKLATVATAIMTGIGKFLTGVGDLLSKGAKNLSDWFSGLTLRGQRIVIVLVGALAVGLAKASPQLIHTIGQIILNILTYLGSIAGDIIRGIVELLIQLIYGLADAIMENSARISAAIANVLIAVFDLLWQVLNRLIVDLLTGILKIVGADDIIEKIQERYQKHALDVSVSLHAYAKEMQQLADETDAAKKTYSESLKDISEAADGTAQASEKASFSIAGLVENYTKAGSSVGGFTNLLGEQSSTVSTLKDQYKDLPGYAYDAIARSMDLPQNNQNKAFDAGSILGGSLGGGFTDGLQNGFDLGSMEDMLSGSGWNMDTSNMLGGDLGSEFSNGFTNGMTDADGYYDAMTENQEDGTIKAIEDKEEDVKEAIKTHVNEPAKKEIRSARQDYYDAGRYCIDGLTKGIEIKQSDFVAAIKKMAEDGKLQFRSAMDINSPSKVFYRNGQYIVAGLIKGVSDNTSRATGTMSSLATSIMSAFSSPIDYVGKIASGELQFDPRIQPVVDISTVTASVRTIRDAFGEQGLSLNGYTGKLAADIGTLDRTNADVVSELRALRSDMADMTDEIANMQMVMDTGALVGSISGTMDKALGRRAIFKGRRN